MPLDAGQSLSHFEILGPLGAGAMGEVYRARDTRLEREVALKVLPEDLADDEDRLRRFEREARILASLNHPNVAQVFGIDQIGDTCFMAMELVPGEDLEARLSRGTLAVAESLDVCRQIAEGMEAAHDAGVIHRDLKPANVVITPDGKVKVLDFGLAKPVDADAGGGSTTDSALSTEAGRLLGTPTYMAPEQARGKPIDKRVDVWALGCVLYECLTGRRAFAGEELGDVLVAVLDREPDWARVPDSVPASVRELLRRCLEKDPRTRLRDVGEARVLLERAASAPARREAPPRRPVMPLLVGALFLVALGLWLGSLWPGRGGEESAHGAILEERLTELVGMEETPAISPDGRTVAFVARVDGKRQVWVRVTGSPEQITHGPYEHSAPRWVDEDTLIYFRHPRGAEPGAIYEAVLLSSTAPRLVFTPARGEADVSHDGKTLALFRVDPEGASLVRVERMGEKTMDVEQLKSAVRYGSPRWSPEDRYLAYEVWVSLGKSEVRVKDLERGETKTIVEAGQIRGLAWLPDGSGLVYASSEGSTLAYPPVFNLRTVARDGSRDVPLALPHTGYSSYVEPDVTSNGELVVSRVHLESDVYRYPIGGTTEQNTLGEERITWQTGLVQVPTVSPDDEEVAYLSDSGGHANIWVTRVDEYAPRQVTFETDPSSMIGLPLWSPTEDRIVYWKRPRVSADPELWLVDPREARHWFLVQSGGAASWSHDGDWVYYMASEGVLGHEPRTEKIRVTGGQPVPVRTEAIGMEVAPDGTGYFIPTLYRSGEVWKVEPPLDGAATRLVREDLMPRIPLWPHQYALSPDGKWLATPLRDDGTTNLWVISTESGELKQVTDFGKRSVTIGRQVDWSSDSASIFAAVMSMDADIVLLEGALP